MWSLVGSAIVSVVMDLIYIILKTNKLNMWIVKDLQLMKMWKINLRRKKNSKVSEMKTIKETKNPWNYEIKFENNEC